VSDQAVRREIQGEELMSGRSFYFLPVLSKLNLLVENPNKNGFRGDEMRIMIQSRQLFRLSPPASVNTHEKWPVACRAQGMNVAWCGARPTLSVVARIDKKISMGR